MNSIAQLPNEQQELYDVIKKEFKGQKYICFSDVVSIVLDKEDISDCRNEVFRSIKENPVLSKYLVNTNRQGKRAVYAIRVNKLYEFLLKYDELRLQQEESVEDKVVSSEQKDVKKISRRKLKGGLEEGGFVPLSKALKETEGEGWYYVYGETLMFLKTNKALSGFLINLHEGQSQYSRPRYGIKREDLPKFLSVYNEQKSIAKQEQAQQKEKATKQENLEERTESECSYMRFIDVVRIARDKKEITHSDFIKLLSLATSDDDLSQHLINAEKERREGKDIPTKIKTIDGVDVYNVRYLVAKSEVPIVVGKIREMEAREQPIKDKDYIPFRDVVRKLYGKNDLSFELATIFEMVRNNPDLNRHLIDVNEDHVDKNCILTSTSNPANVRYVVKNIEVDELIKNVRKLLIKQEEIKKVEVVKKDLEAKVGENYVTFIELIGQIENVDICSDYDKVLKLIKKTPSLKKYLMELQRYSQNGNKIAVYAFKREDVPLVLEEYHRIASKQRIRPKRGEALGNWVRAKNIEKKPSRKKVSFRELIKVINKKEQVTRQEETETRKLDKKFTEQEIMLDGIALKLSPNAAESYYKEYDLNLKSLIEINGELGLNGECIEHIKTNLREHTDSIKSNRGKLEILAEDMIFSINNDTVESIRLNIETEEAEEAV